MPTYIPFILSPLQIVIADFLFPIVLRGRIDVQTKTLRIQVQLVLATRFLQDLSNLSGVLDPTKLDVALALLDRLTDKFRGAGFTLCTDNRSLFLLASLVDEEGSPLGLLLRDLLGFDGGGEFGGEGQMLQEKRREGVRTIQYRQAQRVQ